jgi:uncharacterized protein (TIGR01777 family)
MKILITGGTGLLGKKLGLELHRQGHEVSVTSRTPDEAYSVLPYPPKRVFTLSDLLANESMREEFDSIIHLMGENIAEKRWSDSTKAEMRYSRVDSTEALVQFFKNSSRLKTWIQGAAMGIYPISVSGEVFRESSAIETSERFLAKLCRDWEAPVHHLSQSIRKIILRTGVVFSHEGGAFQKMVEPLIQGVGGVIGSGDQKISGIHIEDWVRITISLLNDSRAQGVYNLTSPEPFSQRELMEKMAEVFGIRLGPSIPGIALKLMLGEMSEVLLQSQAVVSEKIERSQFLFPSLDSMIRDLHQWHAHPSDSESVFQFYAEQFLPLPREELFRFFSEAKNLESITPEWLHFKIKEVSTPGITAGTQIRYQLKVHGIPMKWLTEIREWSPPERFSDNQEQGPYSLWYHLHEFHEVPGGTLMTDWVRYQLPLGKVGRLVGLGKIKSDVRQIFDYRRTKIGQVFKLR